MLYGDPKIISFDSEVVHLKMETSQSHSRRACSVPFLLGIFLVLFCCVKAENKTCPQANANLTPFEQWRSAYYCLQNVSNSCPAKYVLTMSGWLNVTNPDGKTFCSGGCADHTRAVLDCIHHVKRDFWFANNATVQNLNDTIDIGCNSPQGFNGMSIYSGGYRVNSASISSALLGLVLVTLLHM